MDAHERSYLCVPQWKTLRKSEAPRSMLSAREGPVPAASSMDQVHAAWLAAGARGDADAMRRLRRQYPQWLDLQRIVFRCVAVHLKHVGPAIGTATPDSAARQPFCGWKSFHLPTIGASALHTAAWEGSIEILEMLLEEGQDPDTRDDGGLTPTMVSVLHYNVVVMRCVFRNGKAIRRNIVVDCRQEENELLQNVMAVIKPMLRFGADVNTRSQEGYSALHYAANGDALDVARLLLDAGADIDAQDQNGRTPLHQCIYEDSLLVANLLISCGAQIDVKDGNGVTPLTLALRRRNTNMLQIILNHHHLVATAERRDFAADVLMSAVDCGSEEAVRLIVEGGYSSVRVCNSAGETSLHRAIINRNSQLMELIVDLDPSERILTIRTMLGDTPAHYAARYGSTSVVETLVRHLTAMFGDLAVLDDRANPLNRTNHGGLTCLYIAGANDASNCRQRNERDAMIQLLLRQGARLFPRDRIVHGTRTVLADEEQVTLHEQVRRGVALWMREASDRNHETDDTGDGENGGEEGQTSNVLLTELCVEWVASIASMPTSTRPDLSAVLLVVIAAGYAHEFMPLLLEFPVRRSAMPTLLRRLELYSGAPREHPLLRELHNELSEAVARDTDM